MAQIQTKVIADAAVTAAKLSAAVAGTGLAGGGGAALSVNVDAATIEVNVDTLRVVAGGIGANELATDAVGALELSAAAVTKTLTSQLVASWVQVSSFTALGLGGDVTTVVEAAASITTPTASGAVLGILSTGTTITDNAGTATQNYKVQLRDATTDQPISDGAAGEVYGVLDFNLTWNLTYYKADGTAFTFTSTAVDFLFAEVFDLDTLPVNSLLNAPTFGDIANDASSHNHDSRYFTETELGATATADGGSLIGFDNTASGLVASNLSDAIDELKTSISAVADTQAMVTESFVVSALQNDFTLAFAPIGNSIMLSVDGVVQEEDPGTALTGTLTFINASSAITGVGTVFTTEVAVGEYIKLDADSAPALVLTVTDNTNIVLDAVYAGTGGAGAGTVYDNGDYAVNSTALTWLDRDFTLATTDIFQASYVKTV